MIARLALLGLTALSATALDLRNAHIVFRADSATEKKAAEILSQEIEKRTQIRLNRNTDTTGPAIEISRGSGAAEGFTISVTSRTAAIRGNDDRGIIFGTGYFLRQLNMARQRVEVPDGLNVSTAPKIPIRGHQLGYRPKTNAYDGWSVPMWDQYIRELAIFGTNTIELIPPRSDDAADSPHFPLTQIDMMEEMSRIANDYAMDVSIWYPAMDPDYSKPETVDFALKEWGEVFRRLPRIDAIFVPGGDPGHTEPKYLMALLEKQAVSLRRYHPKAQVWISPQSFDKAWLDEFIGILEKQPVWLTGVVFGPQVRGSLADLRGRVPERYPIRFYPDITHSVHSEFPVPNWNYAFAATEGREGINPRPIDQAAIFHRYMPDSTGFVTYSEGCNDDVNKFLWSGLGWNPAANVVDLLRDYAHYFIGGDATEGFAQGLMALERNWQGGDTEITLAQFQDLERHATPQQRLNWRFQEALYRAYYDAFAWRRQTIEAEREEEADAALRKASHTGSLAAMGEAQRILDRDDLPDDARALRARVFELAEALFQSIHMQLSVSRYQAIAVGRGANLDAIDYSLNDRVWLEKQFGEIRALTDEKARQSRLDRIVNWTNPGPGGFYDDLGDLGHQPHLVPGLPYAEDPDFLKSPLVGFGDLPEQGWRVSWFTHAETLGDTPLRMRYTDLDRNAQYVLRVVYGGDAPKVQLRLVANGTYEIHPFQAKPSPVAPVEFEVPRAATQTGELSLEWSKPPGGGGNGRGVQVSEVWLIRR